MYVEITPITNMTAIDRGNAISEEIWAIQKPKSLWQPQDVTRYNFCVFEIESGRVFMNYEPDSIIVVHPDKNLNTLISLFPDLSQQEKDRLVNFINNSSQFEFQYIIPEGTITYETLPTE
jgi:hypothetical protein